MAFENLPDALPFKLYILQRCQPSFSTAYNPSMVFPVTNEHVVKEAAQVRLVASAGILAARVVKVDAANDLVLLKAEGRFAALPVVASRKSKAEGRRQNEEV